jgi:hypothetical protein
MSGYGLQTMAGALLGLAQMRTPDFIIGGKDAPYLRRWFIRPEGLTGGVYLHQILRDDDDRALHDHPWDADVFIFAGSYREVRADCPEGELFTAGTYRRMKAETAHRLVVVDSPVWTLVFFGPRRREWGFHCPQGWVPWQEFVDKDDPGGIGPGCGGSQ